MKKRIFLLGLILAFSYVLKAYSANEYWQTLDGPYWVNGVDVAYGYHDDQGQAGYRYLIGSDGNELKPFHWNPLNSEWNPNLPITGANKIISYKIFNDGGIAFLSAYNDRIYYTANGGGQWDPVRNSEIISNKHFSSIAMPSYIPQGVNAANVVMVATKAIPEVLSTYYTEDGSTWKPIGGANSAIGWEVYDIESFPEAVYPPDMAIGTSGGIYVKSGTWDNPWEARSLFNRPVPVLESILNGHDGAQVAAEISNDGRCNLFSTKGDISQVWTSRDEILVDGSSFDKNVKDISAAYWGDGFISLFAATDEGLFYITYNEDEPAYAVSHDLDYADLKYDLNVQAVDGIFRWGLSEIDTVSVLVSTTRSVYEICEARNIINKDIVSLTVKKAVSGTYLVHADDIARAYQGR